MPFILPPTNAEHAMPDTLPNALAETWLTNNRINLILLEDIPQDGLEATLSTRGGRTVGHQLAHLIYVRRYRLERADKTLLEGLPLIEREHGHDRELLRTAFELYGDAIAELLRRTGAEIETTKGWRGGVVSLLGYLIAHEAHHRGHIMLTLKQAKIKRPERLKTGIWDWNRI